MILPPSKRGTISRLIVIKGYIICLHTVESVASLSGEGLLLPFCYVRPCVSAGPESAAGPGPLTTFWANRGQLRLAFSP